MYDFMLGGKDNYAADREAAERQARAIPQLPWLARQNREFLRRAVRYLAAELGPKGIRVHAISPGPLATRAASGIPEFDKLLDKARAKAPARSLVSIDDVGAATAFLAHDAARLITGETLYIDGGYHIID